MKHRSSAHDEIITIDIAQPGTSELLSILRKYDGSSITQYTGIKNRVAIKQRKQKKSSGNSVSKRVQGFSLGSKKSGSTVAFSRQSCAVTTK